MSESPLAENPRGPEATDLPDSAPGHAAEADEPMAPSFWGDSVSVPAPAVIGVSSEAGEAENPASAIAGFWRRALAFTIDTTMFAAVGLIAGLLFFESLASLGPWGRLLGFSMMLIYFGVFDSSIGRGQTLGKRLMHIRVVDRTGQPIGLPKAMVRYAILAAPVFLNQLMLPVSTLKGPAPYVISVILFGLGGASAYLFVFNRRTRQSAHDLAVGTFVTDAKTCGDVRGSIARVHLIVAAVWLVVSTAAVFASSLLAAQLPAGMWRASSALEATGKVHSASIFIGKSWDSSGGETTYVTVNALLKQPLSDPNATAAEFAAVVLREFPEARDVDVLTVRLTRSFDLGFASAWKGIGVEHPPDEW